jgi:hypothetical protein
MVKGPDGDGWVNGSRFPLEADQFVEAVEKRVAIGGQGTGFASL